MHAPSAPVPSGQGPAVLSLPVPPSAFSSSATTGVGTSVRFAAATSTVPARTGAEIQTAYARPGHGFSFTQGILLGQASMVVLAVLFLRYVVFEDPTISKRINEERRQKRKRARSRSLAGDGLDALRTAEAKRLAGKDRKGKGKASTNGSEASAAAASASTLLDSLAYDLASHAPESLDWLNVLLGQLIGSYRQLAAAHSDGGARTLLEEALNRSTLAAEAEGKEPEQGMVGLDFIEVDEVELGDAFPVLTDARVRPSGMESESVRVEFDVDYSDRVVLAVSTRVVLNFPRPRFAILPVSLSVALERFSGTLTVEIPPQNSTPSATGSRTSAAAHAHPTIHLSLHPDFDLSLATSSLLGSRAKLQDVPKVEQLLVARIRAAIQDRVVWPGRVEVALPSLDRRHHHHHHHHQQPRPASPGNPVPVAHSADFLASDAETMTSPLSPLSASDEHFSSTPPPDGDTADEPTSGRSGRPRFPLRPSYLSASTSGSTTPETPSISLSESGGPSIALHPKIHPPTPGGLALTAELLAAASSAVPTPSPTETLPGYFASKLGRSALSPQLPAHIAAAEKGRTTGRAGGSGGARHRAKGGGGLGLV